MTVKVSVNGEERRVAQGSTIQDLLEIVQAPQRGIAVAKNSTVVRRANYAAEPLEDGDRIEIIQAVAGG